MAAERDINVKVKLKGADTFKKDMASVSTSMSTGFSEITKSILSADVIKSVITSVINGIGNTVDAAVEFQDALAGVGKTVDVSDVGLKNIGYQLMDLSEEIPMTATELAGLAETAGQLGIASGDIVAFTEVVAAMGVSTNMAAEDAATAMAQIAVVFGTSADDYEKMGSTIIDLGNNYATTESDIVDMTQRMAGMAAVVGMTEADTFGLAAAVSSLGIESNAGGSSVQKLLNTVEMAVAGGDVEEFAELCGMTASEFKTMWNTDPTEVVLRLIEGLNNVEASGGSAASVLSNLGLTQSNVTRTLLGLANAGGYTRTAVEQANKAWDENIALTTEAEKRYTTWASRKQIADNKIANSEVSLGELFAEAVISGYEDVADTASAATENLRKVDLAKTVKETNEEYEKQATAITHTTESARSLADILAKMGDYDSLDTEGQKEYLENLSALEALIPGVKQVWDEQTMSFKGGTDAMYGAIDASEQLALSQAEATRTQEQADAYTIVTDSMDDLTQAYTLATAEVDAYAKEIAELDEQISKTSSENERAKLQQQRQSLVEEQRDAEESAAALQKQIDSLSETTEEYAYIMVDYSEAADGVEEATNGMNDALSGSDAAMATLEANLQTQSDMLDELVTEYNEAKEEISGNLGGTVKLFEKVEMPEVGTPQEMIEGLDSQLKFMEDYSTNMKKAQEMGVDSELLSSLADGTAESAAILEQLVNSTPEELAAIEEKMGAVKTQKEELSAQLADVQTNFTEASSSIVETANAMITGADVSTQAYSTAANNVQALINGINSKIGTLSSRVGVVKSLVKQTSGTGSGANGSHAAGLGYVPFDGYIAQLHRGEMVLTALEAKAYRAEQFTNYGMLAALDRKSATTNNNDNRRYESPNNTSVRFGNVYVQKESDVDTLSRKLAKLNTKTSKGVGC